MVSQRLKDSLAALDKVEEYLKDAKNLLQGGQLGAACEKIAAAKVAADFPDLLKSSGSASLVLLLARLEQDCQAGEPSLNGIEKALQEVHRLQPELRRSLNNVNSSFGQT
jgi:hypothetical protein